MASFIPGAHAQDGALQPPRPGLPRRHRRARGRSSRVSALLALSLLAGCGGASAGADPAAAPAPAKETAKDEPFDLQKALAREVDDLSAREIRTAAWSARALAAADVKVAPREEAVALTIPIGTEHHVQCFVYGTMLDAGEAIRQFLKLLDPGKVEISRVAPSGVSVHRETPAIFVQAYYLFPTPRGKAAGMLKIALHADGQHPVACLHDEVGYVRTFERVAKGLFDSLDAKEKAKRPEFVETLIVRIGDVPVGFEHSELLKDEDGQRRWFSRSTSLWPRSPTVLEIEDDASNVILDADGRIQKGIWFESSDGKESRRIELSRKKNFQYEVSGEADGKKVSGTLTVAGKKWLASPLSTARELARLAKGKGPFELKQQEYEPGVNPSELVEIRYARDASGALTMTLGKMQLSGKLAPDGRWETIEAPAGEAKLTFQRAHAAGKL